MSAPKPWYADWTQYICPGPRRRFTPAEMARGGGDPYPRGLNRYVLFNSVLLLLAFGVLGMRGTGSGLLVMGLIIGFVTLAALVESPRLWQQPTRKRLNIAGMLLMLTSGVLAGVSASVAKDLGALSDRLATACVAVGALVSGMVAIGWYFLAIYRVQQIEGRLRERDAQDVRDALQRRLATAQIHPHFVFNTLASLTHWVESGDPRAAPLLKEFNAYLRATLPMFEREQQPLREELALVRHYLAIMQARLGERLQWTVEADPSLSELALPPGSLLTLVENAITHGIEPSLRGGRIALRVQLAAGALQIEVIDSGAGLDGAPAEGLGLSNTRERLLALHPGAQLLLAPTPEGGCVARITIPP